MAEFFSSFIGVAEEKAEQYAGQHAAAMAPVIDTGNQKAKDTDTYSPTADLAENILAINAAPAFPIIKQGTDEAAQGR